MSSGPTLSNLT